MEEEVALRRSDQMSAPEQTGANKKSGCLNKTANDLRGDLFLLIGTIAAFLPLLAFNGERYSVDSPSILLYGQWVHLSAFLDSFRYFGALIAKLYSFTGHDPIQNCLPDSILFILLAGVGTTLLVKCVAAHLKIKRWLPVAALDLAVILSVENVWYCEILTFPESIFLSGVGLLLCFFAIICFIRYRSVRGMAASAVCLILATAVYQQYIIVFTIFVISVLSCEILGDGHATAKAAFLKYAGTAAFILGAGTVYLLLGKAIAKAFHMEGNSRIMPLSLEILDNVRFYITHQHSFLKGRGYFRTEIMTASILLLAIAWFLLFALHVRKKKQISVAIVILLAFAMAYGASYLPGIVSKSHDTRVVFALFSVYFLFACGIVFLGKNKWIAIGVACVLAAVLAANVFVVVQMANSQKEQNRIDLENAAEIVQAIEAHERENGVAVKKLYYCYDQSRETARSGSLFSFDFSMRAILTLQSQKYLQEGNTTVFELAEMPDPVYERYFAGKDWDALDLNEQLVFIGDAAYLCLY